MGWNSAGYVFFPFSYAEGMRVGDCIMYISERPWHIDEGCEMSGYSTQGLLHSIYITVSTRVQTTYLPRQSGPLLLTLLHYVDAYCGIRCCTLLTFVQDASFSVII